MKKVRHILLLIMIIVIMLLLYVLNKPLGYDPQEIDTYFDEKNVIHEYELSFLSKGMTYGEVIRVLGKANKDVGSGRIIFEYKCSSGKVVYLAFENKSTNADEEICLVEIGEPL